MDRKQHWESIYNSRKSSEVSWYQSAPRLSLELLTRAVPDRAAFILDVGGGASTLVDGLLAAGYRSVTVLDLSSAALAQARQRLGAEASRVTWLEGDILSVNLPQATFGVWHDRAVFHFLTDPGDRRRYIDQVRRAIRPGAHVLVATFAEDGPTRCSGLEIVRYSAEALHREFGKDFRLLSSTREEHVTPGGAHQAFVYCLCRYEPPSHALPAA